MEPALVFTTLVATVLALVEFSFLVAAGFRRLGRASFRSPVLRTCIPVVCSVVLTMATVRAQSASAATPPPSVRVVAPAVDEHSERSGPSSESRVDETAYTVERGDSLWRIAKRHIESSGLVADGASVTVLWKSIYELNRKVIGDDPNLILPGQVLSIPGV